MTKEKILKIETEEDYEAALADLERMVTLVEQYEAIHFPMGEVDDAICVRDFQEGVDD